MGDQHSSSTLPTVDELQRLIEDPLQRLIKDLTDDPKATPGDEERRRDTYQLRRVPQRVRDINKDAYTPRFVCIGPFHRGKPGNPLRRERLKVRYVRELLQDAVDGDRAKQGELITRCAESLKTLEGKARWFYGCKARRMESGELVRMLLLDGCFIIKHLYNYASGVNEAELYQTRWAPAQLRIDLLLLENQVPYDVLEALFEHLAPPKLMKGPHSRKRLVLQDMTFWYMMSGKRPQIDWQTLLEPRIHHLLHLMHVLHRAMLEMARQQRQRQAPLAGRLRSKVQGVICGCPVRFMRLLLCRCRCRCHGPGPVDAKDNIASAVELRSMGIKINKAAPRTSGGMLDVRLRDDGVTLEIPPLTIEHATAPLLHNLIAFEQQATLRASSSWPPLGPDRLDNVEVRKRLLPVTDEDHQQELAVEKTGDYFTSYAFLMYNLVNTREDIALLQERGILQNNFGSDDQIINYFKNLCMWNQRNETEIPLGVVLRKLRQCSHNRAYRDWAEVKKYINSPVKILLVILSAVVSASSILQAIFAFRSRS